MRERCCLARFVMATCSTARRLFSPTHFSAFPVRYPRQRTPEDAKDGEDRVTEMEDVMLPPRLRAGAMDTARRTVVLSVLLHRAPLFPAMRTPMGGCDVVALL